MLTRSHLRPLSFQGSELVGVRLRALDSLPDLGGGIVTEPDAGGTVRGATFERTLIDVLDASEVDHTLRRGSALTTARVSFFLEQHRAEPSSRTIT